jgi:integrative and conjugative element protein (TIGR02256 family)
MSTFIPFDGLPLPDPEFTSTCARDLYAFLKAGKHPHVQLVSVCSAPEFLKGYPWTEFLIIDVKAELHQLKRQDILSVERMALGFHPDDKRPPLVLSLRTDFPDVLHLNAMPWDVPRALCISDMAWPEERLLWTSMRFLENLRRWLSKTSQEENHAIDQPLEPVFIGDQGTIILPHDCTPLIGDGSHTTSLVQVEGGPRPVYRVTAGPVREPSASVACLVISAPQQIHKRILRTPTTLNELQAALFDRSFDLYADLRKQLLGFNNDADLKKSLMLLIEVPLTRSQGAPVEQPNIWAVHILSSIADIGKAVGLWRISPDSGKYGPFYGKPFPIDEDPVSIQVLLPLVMLNRTGAAFLSKRAPFPSSVCAIGLGAIGSQIVNLLARSGFGNWSLVDHDNLAPHNVGRHALFTGSIGHPKAREMATQVGSLIGNAAEAIPIVADVLNPGVNAGVLNEALLTASLILDFSASISVARSLANDGSAMARRVSLFISPNGRDSIFLAEDVQRSIPLDVLEMQYYRALVLDEKLNDVLETPGEGVRHSRSCRDRTFVIPNDLVALHAAIGANSVHRLVRQDAAQIRIARVDEQSYSVSTVDVAVSPVCRQKVNGWDLILDDHVIERMGTLRKEKLPNETGGVLIGAFDMQRKYIYVVDVIDSPSDSQESPNCYIRGTLDLQADVQRYASLTDGQLVYIGEWHSHPRGCAAIASRTDEALVSSLHKLRSGDGHPALMAIVGEGGETSLYIDDTNDHAYFTSMANEVNTISA